MISFLIQIDRGLFFAINHGLRNRFFDGLMPLLSWDYLWVAPVVLLALLCVRGSARTRWIVFLLVLVFLLGDAVSGRLLKPFFDRPRPYSTLAGVYKEGSYLTRPQRPSDPGERTLGFPSNHGVNAAGLAVVAVYFFPRVWPLAATLAFLIGLSRVYEGVHYPADVLAGFLFGAALAGLVLLLQQRLIAAFPGRLGRLSRRPMTARAGRASAGVLRTRFPVYAVLYALGASMLSPYYLARGLTERKYLWNLKARLGFELPDLPPASAPRVWVHTLSLGETLSAFGLVDRLAVAGYDLCLSTTTLSGREAVKARMIDPSRVLQFPLDWPPAVRRVQDRVRPDLFVLVETDIWPNFLARLARLGVPAAWVNARVSARSLARYRRVKPWWSRVLALFAFIGAQSEEDRRRLLLLGAPAERLAVTGNLKFDRPAPLSGPAVRRMLLAEAGLAEGVWLVGGSTHPGEDEALLALYGRLYPRFPDLRLLLAPRSPSRFEPVWQRMLALGLPAARRSNGRPMGGGAQLFLLDTLGELDRFYEAADLVFVGKSLPGPGEGGGHNLLEPAARQKPILFGPRMGNFREMAGLILAAGGGRKVADARELEAAVIELLRDPSHRIEMGRRAQGVLRPHQGAVERSAARLVRLLPAAGTRP